MKTIKKLTSFKGSNFLIPMFITSITYTFFPSILKIGTPFSEFFTTSTTFFIIGVLLFVSGVQTDIKKFSSVLSSVGSILIVKVILSIILTIIWSKIFNIGPLGIAAVTICAIMMSCNPGMYLVLLGKNITEKEESGFSLVNLLMLPAIPLLILSIGRTEVNWFMPLVANLLPFILGIFLGMAFPESKKSLRPLSMLLIPFLAITFGAKLNILVALKSAPAGFVLVIIYYVISVFPLALFDRAINKNRGRMAISMSSIAAFSMSIPAFVAPYLKLSESEVSTSISQIAFAVIISSFLTPIIFKKLVNTSEEEITETLIHHIKADSDYPENIVNQINSVDWKAGAYLANKITQRKLHPSDVIFAITTESDELIGFAGFTQKDIIKNDKYGPFLSTMYINPKFRNNGYALQLVNLILTEANKQGFDKINIITQLRGLYEKAGFSEIDTIKDIYGRDMRVLYKDLN